ncbi:acyltransferase family protein [Novosphingobium sp. PY1]|uniref:acyltransferase family protein n=1 Tax=Novosphingobium sp. PY1 TaxID=1882221 RepID=UPI001A9045D5|nr:acyltransferase family protein [Novosphingobium sp. PY1]
MRVSSKTSSASSKTSYRPDIDGLRAIAVTSIVLNHAFPDIFTGGFIGVDVFYVISGYLITGILLAGLNANKFSLAEFYVRRIRRILPALLVVLSITSILVLFLFTPRELADYGKSLIATAAFSSNIYFWTTTGYFTPEAHLIPLLHTWSLAIEEQYYVFFPILLWLAWKLGKVNLFLVAGCAFSLCLSVTLTNGHALAAFYLPPTRAWELLLGAIVAARILPAIEHRHIAKIAMLAGALLLALGFIIINEQSPFPGSLALLPCLGTALIIYAGISDRSSPVSVALSWRPVVMIGWISYSLYLWHWPVISLLYRRFDGLSTTMALQAIALSVALAFLSWWFVERRFHTPPAQLASVDKPQGRRPLTTIGFGTAALAIVAVAGTGLMQLESPTVVRELYPAEIAQLNEAVVHVSSPKKCREPERTLNDPECRIGNAQMPATIALWGDSYADALKPGFAEVLHDHSAYGFILHSCPPILGAVRVDDRREYRNFGAKCIRANQSTVKALEDHPEITEVVIFGQFLNAFDIPDRPVFLVPDHYNPAFADKRMDQITDRIIDTVEILKGMGKKVILIGTFYATQAQGAEDLLARRMWSSRIDGRMSAAIYDRYSKPMNDRLRKIADDRIIFIDPKPVFCRTNDVCDFLPGGKPLLIDDGHLTAEGARRLASMIAQALEAKSTI